jgi:hypothetical protein
MRPRDLPAGYNRISAGRKVNDGHHDVVVMSVVLEEEG